MKLVTLNTWGIHEPYLKRISLIRSELIQLEPDLACLQEVFGPEQENLIKRGTSFAYSHHVQAAGLVILSKKPFLETCELKYKTVSQMDHNDRRAIFVKIRFGKERLWIGNTHLAWKGADEDVRVGQIKELADELRKLGDWLVVTGDFNAGSGSPSIEKLKQAGFVDLFDTFHAGEKIYTWDNDQNPYLKTHSVIFPNRRIDLILASRELAVKIKMKSCKLVFTKPDSEGNLPSDHFGVIAEFD